MGAAPPPRPPDGRSPRWRLGMLFAGALLGGLGYAVLRWPHVLPWTVAGICFALGALLAVSGLLARGR